MSCNKLLLSFLFCLIPFAIFAQRTISGRITDEESGELVANVSVFIANTTVGTITGNEGNYQLQIPGEGAYRLVVSHVGYESVDKDIEPGKASVVFDIALKTAIMEEVTVTAKASYSKKDVDLFWKTILGKNPSKKTIQPLNPEDVYYYLNPETQKLTVSCRVPLQIINHETGYQIQYILSRFTHDYKLNLSSWEGQYMFTELDPKNFLQKNTWKKNRKRVYSVSITNFIRSMYHNSLMKNGFMFVRRETFARRYRPVELEEFLTNDSSSVAKTFYIHPDDWSVMLIAYGKPVTFNNLQKVYFQERIERLDMVGLFRNTIKTPSDSVRIYPDGTYSNSMYLSPVFSSKPVSGIDMFLPLEYYPDGFEQLAAVQPKEVQPVEAQPTHPLTDSLVRVSQRFEQQLSEFSQEKIHLQTDKPYYLSGERIWFRAHVVDAATHVPSFSSASVIAELFDARDSVVCRIKTGFGKDFYSGYIHIPEDTPEGDYTIRAYTPAMRNLDEDYFFMKNIRIGDPMSSIMKAVPEFEFLSNESIVSGFSFSRIRPLGSITPDSLKITVNNNKPVKLRSEEGRSGFSFNLSPTEKQRIMLLDARYEKKPFREYIRIPLPDDDFDVSFYPEGGSSLNGAAGRIAFKAMQSDGTEIDVDGTIYDSRGNEITTFKTEIRGMGQFTMRPESGETYCAVCINSKGQSKRFDLPAAKDAGYALSATWGRDLLMVNVIQPESQKTNDTLCLIVHTRGLVQDALIWMNTSEPIVFQKDFFPSGVSNLLLLTKDMTPISERLVFSLKDDQAKVTSKTDKNTYSARSPVAYSVHLTNELDEPLSGNFSVAVTDDHDVAVDTVFNILTSLLLTSDLRGNIPDPGYYFRKKGQSSVYSFDMLMLTQGWRRYDTERIIKNNLMYPDTLLKMGSTIAGTVRYRDRPVDGAYVSILSVTRNYVGMAEMTYTNQDGRFYLSLGELLDSAAFVVQAAPQENRYFDLKLDRDKVSYPERKIPVIASSMPDREMFAGYADKAELKYVDENGVRILHLSEVTITAPKVRGKNNSFFYKAKDAQFVITEEDINLSQPGITRNLLLQIPGIRIDHQDFISYGSFEEYGKVIFVVDDWIEDDGHWHFRQLHPDDIEQVDFLTGSAAAIFISRSILRFFERPPVYVISITTKRGNPKGRVPNIKPFIPLGIQKPVDFYAPKYDTPAANQKTDLRTTIHWAPNLTTNEDGTASFNFYTADTPSTYTVVIEGVTEDGKIVYKKDKIVVEKQ